MLTKSYNILRFIYRRIKDVVFSIKLYFIDAKGINYDNDKKNVYIITTPEYGNIGDHAISLAMVNYLKQYDRNLNIIEIPDSCFEKNFKWLRRNIKQDDLICLIGGGNFGDLYFISEIRRRLIINTFRNNKIIMFPQSCAWGNSFCSQLEFERSARIYKRHKKLFLLARDKRTYDILKKNFSEKSFLVPDIVFTMKQEYQISDSNIILFVLRSDIEQNIDNKTKEYLIDSVKLLGYDLQFCDTETYSIITRLDSKVIVEDMLKTFASAKAVITDRLHGMIFSQITGTPCLAIDNSTKKVSGVYDLWANKDYALMLSDVQSLDEQLVKLLSLHRVVYNNDKALDIFDNLLKKEIII